MTTNLEYDYMADVMKFVQLAKEEVIWSTAPTLAGQKRG